MNLREEGPYIVHAGLAPLSIQTSEPKFSHDSPGPKKDIPSYRSRTLVCYSAVLSVPSTSPRLLCSELMMIGVLTICCKNASKQQHGWAAWSKKPVHGKADALRGQCMESFCLETGSMHGEMQWWRCVRYIGHI